jgi:hypothetical protein
VERASDPDFAGDYSYLFGFIEAASSTAPPTPFRRQGRRREPHPTVVLGASPTSTLSPLPAVLSDAVAVDSSDQNDWERPDDRQRSLQAGVALQRPEIVLVRNENWAGDIFGNTSAILDKITLRTSSDPDTAYNAFEAGEGDTALVPPGRAKEAEDNYGTTEDVALLGSYFFEINWTDPVVGGPENKLLRQAISQAIDREEINAAVFDDIRPVSTGITPEGIPGWKSGCTTRHRSGRGRRRRSILEDRGQPAHRADQDPAQRRSTHEDTVHHRGQPRPSASTRPTPAAGDAPRASKRVPGLPDGLKWRTIRRTTTSCTTCSTPTPSVATTTVSTPTRTSTG